MAFVSRLYKQHIRSTYVKSDCIPCRACDCAEPWVYCVFYLMQFIMCASHVLLL